MPVLLNLCTDSGAACGVASLLGPGKIRHLAAVSAGAVRDRVLGVVETFMI